MMANLYYDPLSLEHARARYQAIMAGHPVPGRKLKGKRIRNRRVVKRDYILVASATEPRDTSIKQIISNVAASFGFGYGDVVGDRRTRDVMKARFAAYHAIATARPNYSLAQIGRCFGGRDHTTILVALRKMKRDGVPQPDGAPIQHFSEVA
jgi:hypothetical protein